MSFGETRTLIVVSDESVTVRCAAGHDDQPRWLRTRSPPGTDGGTDAGTDAGDDGGRVLVSARRRLVLDVGPSSDRDGVYLCVVTDSASSTSRLAANLTIVSPCKHIESLERDKLTLTTTTNFGCCRRVSLFNGRSSSNFFIEIF